MKISKKFFILITYELVLTASAYRILAVFPLNGKSHNIFLESVAKTLANHGHQVDLVTHFPQKNSSKNLNVIVNLKGTMESIANSFSFEILSKLHQDFLSFVTEKCGNKLCHFMGLEEFQKLIKNPPQDPPYDLVIVEAFAASCYYGLGYVFKVPVVAISTSIEYPWVSNFIGNADNPAIVPNRYFPIAIKKMNFWERLLNFYYNFIIVSKFHESTYKSQTESMRNYLRPDISDIREVEKNVALILVNSHPILFGVKPITPGVVQIAGLHIEANEKTLPEDLKKWMEESTQGVIYFTFGSIVLIETLPVKLLREIFASFEKISPVRVLIKIFDESKLPLALPKNVKSLLWVPQQSVLAHPNTKAFITHGGVASLEEALYFGVPMIGIPLFSDQFRNVESFTSKGIMLRINFNELSEKTLDVALSAVLGNPDHKKNAVRYSKLFLDRPMTATDTTIFWIEYVIRNGGEVLKSPALELYWWQLNLLDVYGFILLVMVCSVLVTILSLRLTLKICTKKIKSNDLTKKDKIN